MEKFNYFSSDVSCLLPLRSKEEFTNLSRNQWNFKHFLSPWVQCGPCLLPNLTSKLSACLLSVFSCLTGKVAYPLYVAYG